jgi:hypothetical protein
LKIIILKFIYLFMRAFGFRGYSASLAIKRIKKDFLNRNVPITTKIWAWKRGFSGTRAQTYGVDETNYKNHIPDFDYYKLHPINSKYSNWIDDKLTMKYILSPFNAFLPKYYFQIEDGEILKLMDCPEEVLHNIEGIINLLKRNGNLALKPLSGSLGVGFNKLTYKENSFYINTKKINLNELKSIIKNLNGYLITEYIVAHNDIRKIYDITPNTVRVQLIRDKNKEPKIIGSFIRFGTEKSGVLESPTAGGIIAKVDVSDGYVHEAYTILNDRLIKLDNHPNTGQSIEINLPFWNLIKLKICEISNYLPQLSFMGFDIIITCDNFKIIEINSLTSTTVLPYYYPLLADDYSKEFFKRKFSNNPRKFKRILKTMN